MKSNCRQRRVDLFFSISHKSSKASGFEGNLILESQRNIELRICLKDNLKLYYLVFFHLLKNTGTLHQSHKIFYRRIDNQLSVLFDVQFQVYRSVFSNPVPCVLNRWIGSKKLSSIFFIPVVIKSCG